ncbi:MAG: transcriptional repressor [Bacteroidales bacterium]|nr:transcriptional repressor [Bacteroidales bacterium]
MDTSIDELLQSSGIRATANRILVARTMLQSDKPMSLIEIEDTLLSIDKSVIFRTLRLFSDNHLVHVIEDGSGCVRYEICHSHHHHDDDDEDDNSHHDDDLHPHFYCEVCRQTFCLHEIKLPHIDAPEGFDIRTVNCVVKGVCKKCRKAIR